MWYGLTLDTKNQHRIQIDTDHSHRGGCIKQPNPQYPPQRKSSLLQRP